MVENYWQWDNWVILLDFGIGLSDIVMSVLIFLFTIFIDLYFYCMGCSLLNLIKDKDRAR